MKSKVVLSIIIPTFNTKKYISACIDSILKSNTKNFEIIIIDNASTDNTIAFLKKKFKKQTAKIKYLSLNQNYGPAKARNEGVKIASGKYLSFLDSDTIVTPDWASQAIKCLKSDTKIAAVQCKLLLAKNKKQLDYVGEYLGKTGFLVPVAPHGEIDHGQYDSTKQILAAKSAGMFIKKRIFNKIGGFDEDYFIFVEETDLGWRCWLAGYQVILCPSSIVYHHFSATKSVVDEKFNNYLVRFHGTKNYILTLYKNLSTGYLIKILPLHIILWLGLSFYLTLTGNFQSSVNIIRGILWHISNIIKNTHKRNIIQKQRQVSDQLLFTKHGLLKQKSIYKHITKFLSSQKSSVNLKNQ